MMGVPFIDIKRYEEGFLQEWEIKVKEMSKNASFIGGPEVAALEKTLCEWTNTGYTVSCANGTDAIQLALRAVGVGKDDKVILPDSTFWATFESVVNVNANPYTVDTNLEDFQMDFTEFETAVNKVNPKAAILVHLYGWGSNRLEDYRELCKKKKIALIEDGAQCFGVQYKGESIYKDSYISTTSFYPAKVLGAAGDGGAVFTNDKDLADRVRILANHGRTTHYGHGAVGWNSRMDSLQACFLNISLKHFGKRLESRIYWANRYTELLKKINIKQIRPGKDFLENGYCNVIFPGNEKRPALESILKEHGIGFGIIYPGSMSTQEGAKPFLQEKIGGNNSEILSSGVLNLPLFPYMKEEEFKEVSAVLEKF